MNELGKATWPEAQSAFGAHTVAILPVGTIEPHGPHLPLDTDVTIARAMAREAARRIELLGVRALVLPPIPFGVTEYTKGFPGRISLQPGTLWSLVDDVIVSLEQQGIERVLVVNGHLEPAHVEVLRGVLLDHAQRVPRRAHAVLVDVSRRKLAERLGAEFQSGDCHAGSYESSIVLAEDPASVRERERAKLPALAIGLIEKMKAGVRSFRDAGAAQAYCGDPAAASAEEGRALVAKLGELALETATSAWPDLFGADARADGALSSPG